MLDQRGRPLFDALWAFFQEHQYCGDLDVIHREEVFDAVVAAQCNGILAIEDSMLFSHLTRIVESAARSRLPAMYAFRHFADAGGLMSYGPNTPDSFRRAAVYVDKILKGAKPSDLPIEQPTKFELIVNLKTAKALGLTIPQSVLLRADQVIE